MDYRQLNSKTIKDSLLIFWKDRTLNTLFGFRLFSTLDLDLKSGFLKWYEPFVIYSGIRKIIGEGITKIVVENLCGLYLDDVIVIGKTFDDYW